MPLRRLLPFALLLLVGVAALAVPGARAAQPPPPADVPVIPLAATGVDRANTLAYSPDGRWLAVGTATGWALYAADTLERRYVVTTATWVRSLAFSPDGQMLVTGSYDPIVRLWQVSDGALSQRRSDQDDVVAPARLLECPHLLGCGRTGGCGQRLVGRRPRERPDEALEIPAGDITREAALDEVGCAATMAFGMEAVAGGIDLLCIGEMGIGNTTIAAAIFFALYGGAAADWAGRGTGVDDAGHGIADLRVVGEDEGFTAAAAEKRRIRLSICRAHYCTPPVDCCFGLTAAPAS